MVNVAQFFEAEVMKLKKQLEETKYRLTPIQDEVTILEAKIQAFMLAGINLARKGEG